MLTRPIAHTTYVLVSSRGEVLDRNIVDPADVGCTRRRDLGHRITRIAPSVGERAAYILRQRGKAAVRLSLVPTGQIHRYVARALQ